MTVVSALYTSTLQRFLGQDSVQNQVEFLEKILGNTPAVLLLVFLIAGMAPICEEASSFAASFTALRGRLDWRRSGS